MIFYFEIHLGKSFLFSEKIQEIKQAVSRHGYNWQRKLFMADWLKTWETQAAGSLSSHLWACVCVSACVSVCAVSQLLRMKLAIKLSPLAAVCIPDSRSDLLILLMHFILRSQHQAARWGVTTAHQPLSSFPHPFILCTHSHLSIITQVLPGRVVCIYPLN